VANGLFYVFDDDKIYRIERYGAVQRHPLTAAELKQFRHRITVADELEGGRLKTQMEEHGYRVVIHLSTKEEFVGYLVLGDKLSGDIYTDQDIEVLQILAQELAVAISNAKAYQEIANFNATLQHKVAVATKRLREANIHLKELDKAKDEFISMASHQLRTPLTTIKGYLSMLDEGDAGKLTKQQREFVGYAYAGSERMVNLISDLLNVSRMSTGKFLISKTPIDLIKMAADEVQQLQSHAKAKGLELIFAPQNKPLPSVMLDDNKTRQVIMNFIDNAIYYTKAGSVKVGVAQVGKRVELRVTDTGIGVPKEAQKQLFTKFYRAANAQNVRPDGTGLGLYLAKRVVEDQGGTIIFETTEGKGSTFGFSLPLTTNQEASDAASQ
jgi:signal transduction histidine kinase